MMIDFILLMVVVFILFKIFKNNDWPNTIIKTIIVGIIIWFIFNSLDKHVKCPITKNDIMLEECYKKTSSKYNDVIVNEYNNFIDQNNF